MKAILVINLPNNISIDDCRIEYSVFENATNACVENDFIRLKPMPQKKKPDIDLFWNKNFILEYAEFDGYNKCIDEILGEEE